MADNAIYVKKYGSDALPTPDVREIWRYAGCQTIPDSGESALHEKLSQVLREAAMDIACRVCWRFVDISSESAPFPGSSRDLAKCLSGSREAVVFAATVGIDIDRRIARWQRLDPVKALILQGFGAERVEALCDAFCRELRAKFAAEGRVCTPRFSPGYGDLALERQRDVFALLDCPRQIGLFLNESLLMTPSKSVTAIFGIKDQRLL